MFRYCDKSPIVTLLSFPNSVTISDCHCIISNSGLCTHSHIIHLDGLGLRLRQRFRGRQHEQRCERANRRRRGGGHRKVTDWTLRVQARTLYLSPILLGISNRKEAPHMNAARMLYNARAHNITILRMMSLEPRRIKRETAADQMISKYTTTMYSAIHPLRRGFDDCVF